MSKIFNPGDVVLDQCEPFIIQIDDNERDKRCHYCMTLCDNLKRCGNCHQVKYCSKECQRLDWKDIHKFNECKLLKEFNIDFGQMQRTVIRMILKVKFDPNSRKRVYRLWDNRERRVDDLISHKDKINQDSTKQMIIKMQGVLLISMFDKLFNVKLTMDDFCHWFGVIAVNFTSVGNQFYGNNESYAVAVYIDASALNHDCKPSCFPWFNGRKLQIRAMRTIDASVEQPTIFYIDIAQDRDTRRKLLAERYYFECQCNRCVTHDDKDFDYRSFLNMTKNTRDVDAEHWDKVLVLEQHLVGPHYPTTTYMLYRKWMIIGKRIVDHKESHLIKKWNILAKELDNEFVITHGKEHRDYKTFVDHFKEMEIITKMVKL